VSNAVRVLVVEDEVPICSFIEDALSDGGFKACSVRSGEAALSTFRDGRERCSALLTDVNLGDGISGPAQLAIAVSQLLDTGTAPG
jgi:DNA-binding response OmpR family regulator